jgi:hypothetical protein
LAGPPILHHSRLAQQGEVAGDLGLGEVEGLDQLADAQLPLLLEEHHATQPGRVGEEGEETVGSVGHNLSIHRNEYTCKQIFFGMAGATLRRRWSVAVWAPE